MDEILQFAADHSTAVAWGLGLTLVLLLVRDVRGNVAASQRRRAEYHRGYAAARGVSLTPSALPELPAFRCLDERSPSDSWHGRSGQTDIWVFEFDDGYEQQIRLQTVVCLVGPPCGLPSFLIEPAGFFGPGGAVEFPDHPEFSNRYIVARYNPEGADGPDIAQAVSRPFREALVERPGLSLECMRDHLLVYRSGRLVPPPELPAIVSDALALHGLLSAGRAT